MCMQGVDCTVPPAQSVDGDLLLQLDDCTLTAHAPLFQLASTTFAGALACSSQREAAGETWTFKQFLLSQKQSPFSQGWLGPIMPQQGDPTPLVWC